MKPIEEPSLNPSKIKSVPEDKRAKRIPLQHIIRMRWTKKLKRRVNNPQEDLGTDNKKVQLLETQSIWVVEEVRVDATLYVVEADPEAASEVAAITPLYFK